MRRLTLLLTLSIAAAQSCFESGRPAWTVTASRSITSLAPSDRSQSAASGLPLEACTV